MEPTAPPPSGHACRIRPGRERSSLASASKALALGADRGTVAVNVNGTAATEEAVALVEEITAAAAVKEGRGGNGDRGAGRF